MSLSTKMATTTTTGRPVTIWMQRAAVTRLDQAAKVLGISRSDLVRVAIDDAVETALKKEAKRVRQSAK